jgi:hypothetical protein
MTDDAGGSAFSVMYLMGKTIKPIMNVEYIAKAI